MATIYVQVDSKIVNLIRDLEEYGILVTTPAVALEMEPGEVVDVISRILDVTNTPYHIVWPDPVEVPVQAVEILAAWRPEQAAEAKALEERLDQVAPAVEDESLPVCPYCKERYKPRTRKQTHCGKEECKKAKGRDWWREHRSKKNGEAVESDPDGAERSFWLYASRPVETLPEVVPADPAPERLFEPMADADMQLEIEPDPDGVPVYHLANGAQLSQYQMMALLRSKQLIAGTLVRHVDRGWMMVNGAGQLRETDLGHDANASMLAKFAVMNLRYAEGREG